MRHFVSIILTAAVLLHATLGCCFHHAHSCEADCCDTPSKTADGCPCHSDEHRESSDVTSHDEHHSDHDRPHHDRPHHGRHKCEGAECSFARTESASVTDSLEAGKYIAVWTLSFTCVADFSPTVSMPTRPGNSDPGELRRHLVLAVLLI
jgi:hypothetical protein